MEKYVGWYGQVHCEHVAQCMCMYTCVCSGVGTLAKLTGFMRRANTRKNWKCPRRDQRLVCSVCVCVWVGGCMWDVCGEGVVMHIYTYRHMPDYLYGSAIYIECAQV